jgi:O-antigen ligase
LEQTVKPFQIASTVKDRRPAILGILLAAMMLFQVLGRGESWIIQGSSLLTLIAFFAITFSYRITNTFPAGLFVLFGVFAFTLLFSGINAAQTLGADVMIRVIAVLAFLCVGILLAQRREHQLLEQAFPVFSLAIVAVIVFVLYDNDRIFARLSGHLHPNLWGFIAATSIVGLVYLRAPLMIKIALVGFILYMLAFEFQTRAALIWATFGALVFGAYEFFLKVRTSRWILPGYTFIITLGAIFLIVSIYLSDWVFYDVLDGGSATRGVGSGLTGRTEIWPLFLSTYAEKPIFGHGFDMSRYFAENYFGAYVAGEISSTHNSYLTILFDMGIFGFSLYFCILTIALFGALSSKRKSLFAFFVVYSLMGITESRPLNVGNPSAIFFVLLLPYCASRAFKFSEGRL